MKRYLYLILLTASLAVLVLTFFSGVRKRSATEDKSFVIPDSLFMSGDLIFREGRGYISEVFRKLSIKDPSYSHAGIVHREGSSAFVYHLIGGEEKKNSIIRKERLDVFCSVEQAKSFAVYRFGLDGKMIDEVATKYYAQRIVFDANFDLATDDKMYCTEFLYKVLTRVSGDENYLPLTNYRGIKYEACDDIYLSPHSKKIYSLNYRSKNQE